MFGKLFNFVAPFFRAENYARGAKLQARADFFHLFLLSKANQTWPEVKVKTLEQIRELAPTFHAQQEAVKQHVRERTLTHLQRWREERPPPLDPVDPEKPLDEARRLQVEAEHAAQVYEAQKRAFGFALRVAPSEAGHASGRGVFVDGAMPPGTVIALYPGVWYETEHLLQLPRAEDYFKGNEYLIARYDKVVFDASPNALRVASPEALANPLTVAHLINHPPAGKKPNVMHAPLDIDTELPPELVSLLPNVSYQRAKSKLIASSVQSPQQRALLAGGLSQAEAPGVKRGTVMDIISANLVQSIQADDDVNTYHGLALLTNRPVKNEELFLNYRLNPRLPYPKWYTPVDVEEDTRRWERW
ncbi:hypothetical protein AB1Y20_013053 [Prymnesium parvum]|uniref:SET domain-containing protein n=1 Tax=Prymnesium parvum TaxID=97485 RepID=A0AB34IN77_PRYPA